MSIKLPSKFNFKYYATIGSKCSNDTNLTFGILFQSSTFKIMFQESQDVPTVGSKIVTMEFDLLYKQTC